MQTELLRPSPIASILYLGTGGRLPASFDQWLQAWGFLFLGHARSIEEMEEVLENEEVSLIIWEVTTEFPHRDDVLLRRLHQQWAIPYLLWLEDISAMAMDLIEAYPPAGHLLATPTKDFWRISIKQLTNNSFQHKQENAGLSKLLKEKEIIIQISEALATLRSQDDLFGFVRDTLKPILQFHGSFNIYTIEPDGTHYSFFFNALQIEEPHSEGQLHRKYAITDPIFSMIMNADGPLLIVRDEMLARYPGLWGLKTMKHLGIEEAMMAPLKIQGKVIGICSVHAKIRGWFGEEQLSLFQLIANSVAAAVSNIQANEAIIQAKEEIERLHQSLNHFNQTLTPIKERGQLQQLITDLVRTLTPMDGFYLTYFTEDYQYQGFLINQMDEEVVKYLPEQVKRTKRWPTLPLQGDMQRAIDRIKEMDVELLDYENFPVYWKPYPISYAAKQGGIKESLLIWLKMAGEVIGVLSLQSKVRARFDHLNRNYLRQISKPIAVAVHNLLQYEKLQAAKWQIEESDKVKSLQLEIANTLNQYPDWEKRFLHLSAIFQSIIPFDFLCFHLSNQKRQDLWFYQQIELLEHRSLSREELQQLLKKSKPELENDLRVEVNQYRRGLINSGKSAALLNPPLNTLLTDRLNLADRLSWPIRLSNNQLFLMVFYHKQAETYLPQHLELLRKLIDSMSAQLDKLWAFQQIEELSQLLQKEKEYLEEEIKIRYNFDEIVGKSTALQEVLQKMEQVANTDTTVLITGESGTGKELVARAIHNISDRKGRPLIKLNCAALPPQLLESELFGHEVGSFTGATERRMGKFELADEGTIFLDEIGEMPIGLQAKLLRFIQEREFERLGSNQVLRVNVRIIAATNRNLEAAILAGKFRADLFFRLNVFPIHLPPLRARKEDILPLSLHFLQRSARQQGKEIKGISKSSLDELTSYDWPGNIRELEHIIERAVIMNKHNTLKITLDDMKVIYDGNGENDKGPFAFRTLEEVERELILNTLRFCNGKVRGAGGAAEKLNIHPNTLDSRMKKLGIVKTHVSKDVKH